MTPPRQLPLPLPVRVSLGREDYFVSESNRAALHAVEAWPDWAGRMLAVIGPDGSGKTHLAGLHAARMEAAGGANDLIVEDADRRAGNRAEEEALFHAFNRVAGESGSILFTARTPLAGWAIALPDLRTRLNTVVSVELPAPDDELLFAVLLKHFADRQIGADRAADVAAWLVPRMDRSLGAARALVAEIDHRSLAQKRRIDVRLAGDVLNGTTPR